MYRDQHHKAFQPRIIRCPLCLGETEDWRFRRGFSLRHCKQCDNGYIPGFLLPGDTDSVYSIGYFRGETNTGYPDYLADREIIEANFADRIKWISSIRPKGRLLEVGSAYGFFLKVAREQGWDARGVELVEECAREAARLSGATVQAGDFLEIDIPGRFEVVTMFDVIEHMRDPVACIERAYNLLSPEGVLVIETGDHAAPWARFLGNFWYFLDPPQHRYYFSQAGIEYLLRRTGFENDFLVRRMGRRVSSSNIGFKLSAALPRGRVQTAIADRSRKQIPGSLYLNFGDGLLIAATKRRTNISAADLPRVQQPIAERRRGREPKAMADLEIEELRVNSDRIVLTIDVEDWFHANFQSAGTYHDETLPSRVRPGVDALLDMLERKHGHATFFLLGCVAERYPDIVRRIADAGHEVACHGWSHSLVYRQSAHQFEQDILRARSLLRELSAQEVIGFRAPSWSITNNSLWALNILAEQGFKYDSSIFPAATYLYGVDRAPVVPYRIKLRSEKRLIEIPPSVLQLAGRRLGVGGGFYLRALPLRLQRAVIRSYAARGAPFLFYVHPREFDPESWKLRLPLSFKEQLIHRFGISKSRAKLGSLLVEEPCSIAAILAGHL
ncbi:MAG: DUF3473 domain-containing protein [Deltaproteobacteria bacterium]|nr:DUF3473 domain-containing protein [Deltaproteobacteria bacterium]